MPIDKGESAIAEIDLELKRLEHDKKIEEIRQLKSNSKRQWITPAALGVLLPAAGVFGLWVYGEIKSFSQWHKDAVENVDLKREREELEIEKDRLYKEVVALATLTQFHRDEAEAQRRLTQERQKQLDETYLRARYASFNAHYALGLVSAFGGEDDEVLIDQVEQSSDTLTPDASASLQRLFERYRIAVEMTDVSKQTLKALSETLELVPVSAWAKELNPELNGGQWEQRLMRTDAGDGSRYYDVDEARFLEDDELPQSLRTLLND